MAISLIGLRLRPATFLFLGWFGPRGIATIVLTLVATSESDLDGADTIALVAGVAVLMSVIAHGATAAPLGRRYGRVDEGDGRGRAGDAARARRAHPLRG